MKKIVLFGAGQAGAAVSRLLGADWEAVCFADNDRENGARSWRIFRCSPRRRACAGAGLLLPLRPERRAPGTDGAAAPGAGHFSHARL